MNRFRLVYKPWFHKSVRVVHRIVFLRTGSPGAAGNPLNPLFHLLRFTSPAGGSQALVLPGRDRGSSDSFVQSGVHD